MGNRIGWIGGKIGDEKFIYWEKEELRRWEDFVNRSKILKQNGHNIIKQEEIKEVLVAIEQITVNNAYWTLKDITERVSLSQARVNIIISQMKKEGKVKKISRKYWVLL